MNPTAMSKVRPYLPLIGFLIPTIVVGYGFVIPQSCIAGVNELTVGFGTTILGAALTYVAGQRAIQPKGACLAPPLRLRLVRAVNRQAASPRGWFGRVLGLIWPREHGRLNAEVLDALDLRLHQRVLEIGTGSGHALRETARRVAPGRVVGIDVSELMADSSRRLNREAIAQGAVEVLTGDIETIDLSGATFDRVYSVNCIYFWREPDRVLSSLAAAVAPGGKLVLAFIPEGDGVPARLRDPVYRFPHVVGVRASLEGAGLTVETRDAETSRGVVILTATRA